MVKFLLEARRNLPGNVPDGTLIKIPINKLTGQISLNPTDEVKEDFEFYRFLRSDGEWLYLGRGLISSKHDHLFNSIHLYL